MKTMSKNIAVFCAITLVIAFVILRHSPSANTIALKKPVISFPEMRQPEKLPGGIDFYEVVASDISARKLWIYLPEHHRSAKLPCVFIAPAGSPCITGMSLGEGDQPEHIPYVQAGYAVVAYELDGELSRDASNREFTAAVAKFRAVEGGVLNGKAAIDYALAKIPAIDGQRLYSAGHSSAATVSLLLAENDPRIKACIAYAPVFDVTKNVDAQLVKYFEREMPDFRNYLTQISPATKINQLTCPVFLFHADDDDTVTRDTVEPYVETLKRKNAKTQYVTVPTGGHYDSMIHDGVPKAISWLHQLAQ